MTRRLRRTAFAAVATAAGLLLLEGAGRVFEVVWPEPVRSLATPAPARGGGAGGSFSHHEQPLGSLDDLGIRMVGDPQTGWRLEETGTPPPGGRPLVATHLGQVSSRVGGEVRIVGLGDSGPYGFGVASDETYLEVAAAALAESWGTPVAAVNAAVPGHDSGQSLALLPLIADAAQPDWVVCASLWSDVYHATGLHAELVDSTRLLAGPLTHSALFRLMHRMLEPQILPVKIGWIDSRDDIGADPTGAFCRVPLSAYRDNLERLVDLARSLDARTAFIALPALMDLDPVPPPETVRAYREVMRRVAEGSGSPLLDGPVLFSAEPGANPAFIDTVHPNVTGHALLGRALAQLLETAESGDPP
jgi:lysophospholipase L1-like esterase